MRNIPLRQVAHFLSSPLETELQLSGYQIDSRSVSEGDLFFALPGEKSDGHFHLAEVRARGGIAAVVSNGYRGESFGLTLLPVEDVAKSLQTLALAFLSQKRPFIIAITGSVGKTTVKEFTATLLSSKYRVGKNLASFNTKLTLPLTLLNRTGDEEVFILEMGMSEPGDIGRLLQIVSPDIAMITKVGLAHAANFPGGMEEIALGKREIFSDPKTKIALFDADFAPYAETIQKEKWTFSLENRSADYFLSLHDQKAHHYAIDERGVRAHLLDLPFEEMHILHNFLAAASIARQMQMSWDEIQAQIPLLQLPKMRFEKVEKGGVLFINDAYNANPESMKAALMNLPAPQEGGKKIGVLGSMKELGPFSTQEHRDIGLFAQKYLDHLLVLGDETKDLLEAFQEAKKPSEFFQDHESLAEYLTRLICPGDVVLIKGSRSMRMETVLERLSCFC